MSRLSRHILALPSLVACWPLGEAAGATQFDDILAAAVATPHGAGFTAGSAIIAADGTKSVANSSGTAYMSTTLSPPGTGEFTYMAVFKTTASGVMVMLGDDVAGIWMGLYNGLPTISCGGGDTVSGPTTYNDGVRHMIAVRR